MDLITPKHFSLSDWQFYAPTYFNIYAPDFVSAPSSLRAGGYPAAGLFSKAWLKESLSGNLKQGKLRTWFKHAPWHDAHLWIYFREQDMLHTEPTLNGYRFNYALPGMMIAEMSSGGAHRSWAFPPAGPLPDNTWYEWELTFWTWLNLDLIPYMTVQVKHIVGANEYTDILLNIPNPLFSDSAHNYIAIAARCNTTPPSHLIDDTRIYRPA